MNSEYMNDLLQIDRLPNRDQIRWVIDSFQNRDLVELWNESYALTCWYHDRDMINHSRLDKMNSRNLVRRILSYLSEIVSNKHPCFKNENQRTNLTLAYMAVYRTLSVLVDDDSAGQYLYWDWEQLKIVGDLGCKQEMQMMIPAAWVYGQRNAAS